MNEQTFQSLGLTPSILSVLAEEGYERPTPIQAASIPSLLLGRDLLGTAQTGTGKTAAFALPIIQLLSARPARREPKSCRVLVVAPTRELAAQIDESFGAYGRRAGLSRACVFGGVGKTPQIRALSRGVDILVATPGRLLDLHHEGALRLDLAEIVVLDEADRMLDMGFIRDVRKIVALLPSERQTLLFSATMPRDIEHLASTILRDPARVAVTPEKPAVELIDQKVAYLTKSGKRAFITEYIRQAAVERAIVFTRTKHGADRLAKALCLDGIGAEAIHANKSQNHRTRTLANFKNGSIRVLVATDLAARGIDVDAITHIFNYELPNEPETYVHRIGRTARAGASGFAIAFCDEEEKPLLRAIERLIGRKVSLAEGPAFDSAYAAAKIAAAQKPSAADEAADRREMRKPDRRSSRRGEYSGSGAESGAARGPGRRSSPEGAPRRGGEGPAPGGARGASRGPGARPRSGFGGTPRTRRSA